MSQDARVLARRYYQRHGRDFSEDSLDIAANERGIFVYLPQLVVLMKPVRFDDEASFLPLSSTPEDADTWYVHLLVGDVPLALSLASSLDSLPFFCFQRSTRGSDWHRCSWSRLIQKYNNHQ